MDLNNDGKKDIVAGSYFGSVHWFSGTDTEEYHNEGEIISNGTVYNCEKFAHPALADLNNDGLIDLLVTGQKMWWQNGKKFNYALFYNIGTKENYEFDEPLIWKEDGGLTLYNHYASAVQFIDINRDGLLDLVASENLGGQIKYYENIGTEETLEFDNPFTLTTGEGSKTWLGYSGNSNPDVKHEVCDWNGDGAWDMIFGGNNKINRLYISYGTLQNVDKVNKLGVKKNSAKNEVLSFSDKQITLLNKTEDYMTYSIIGINGKYVAENQSLQPKEKLKIDALASGVYLVKAISNSGPLLHKLNVR